MVDFALFQLCFTGPHDAPDFTPPVEACTEPFDYDGDDDIDIDDYAFYFAQLTD